MSNIAEIGFAADTSELVKAKKALDDLPPAAGRAQKASDKLAATLGKVDAAADKIAAAAQGLSTASSNVAAAAAGLVAAADRITGAMGKQSSATDKASQSTQAYSTITAGVVYNVSQLGTVATTAAAGITAQGNAAAVAAGKMDQLDDHVAAYRANLRQLKIDAMAAGTGTQQLDAHMTAYRDHLDTTAVNARKVGQAIKFSATDSLNASRQLADIGVTLAMGMSPFMVAIQQGPQLLDILQNKAAQTGTTLTTVFRAAGVAIWTALAPILPLIAGIALVIGTIAGAFALATRAINGNTKSIADGMNLTEKQLERVKKAGVDTSVTIGDTFTATFQVLGERFTDAFEKPIKATNKLVDQVFNTWTKWGADTARNIIAAFTAAYYGIVALWKTMPKTFAGIGSLIANGFISVFEVMINRALAQVNGINQKINGALKAVGVDFQFADLAPVKLGRIANAEASKAADAFAKGANDGWAEGLKKGDRLFADIMARARKNRTKLINEAAGDGDKAKKARKQKEKKDPLDRLGIQRVYEDPFGQKDIDAFDMTMRTKVGDPPELQGLDKAYEAYRQQVDFAKEATRGFIDDLRGNLAQGEGLFKSFANAVSSSLNRVFDKLLDKTLNVALEGLFGGNGGGFLGSLFGSVGKASSGFQSTPGFSIPGGSAVKYAKGDVFDKPTVFSGRGKLSVMGEAGPEAVMPLTRGVDGSLGVAMHGGSDGGSTFAPNISINPTYVLSGAISSADVQRSIRQAGDQQAQDLRKAIPGILQDYQMNGALA